MLFTQPFVSQSIPNYDPVFANFSILFSYSCKKTKQVNKNGQGHPRRRYSFAWRLHSTSAGIETGKYVDWWRVSHVMNRTNQDPASILCFHYAVSDVPARWQQPGIREQRVSRLVVSFRVGSQLNPCESKCNIRHLFSLEPMHTRGKFLKTVTRD